MLCRGSQRGPQLSTSSLVPIPASAIGSPTQSTSTHEGRRPCAMCHPLASTAERPSALSFKLPTSPSAPTSLQGWASKLVDPTHITMQPPQATHLIQRSLDLLLHTRLSDANDPGGFLQRGLQVEAQACTKDVHAMHAGYCVAPPWSYPGLLHGECCTRDCSNRAVCLATDTCLIQSTRRFLTCSEPQGPYVAYALGA